ncbi:MAG: DNA polymerase III subunit delta' [Cyanobacteria bacterium SBLK]|nr:DNA polymerase III subunit delta' [Cyanobacteria bacterium SBLK]
MSFANLIGQQQAIALLDRAIVKDKIAPAYLFAGTAGVGKRLAALAFSELLLSQHRPESQHSLIRQKIQAKNHPDFFWVQPTYQHQGQLLTEQEAAESGLKRRSPPQIRVEQIRAISEFLARPPLEAARSVVVLEDAQTMAESAANALLKTLEEPGRATIILIVPSGDSLLSTLVSRCQRIPFYRLSREQVEQICRDRGRDEILDDPIVLNIAQGSPGEAIAAWEQVQQIPSDLLKKLAEFPKAPQNALELAKEVDKLDTKAQLWVLDYLQYCYWQKHQKRSLLEQLEQAKKYLLAYGQPRLVWECLLLSFMGC